MAAKKKKENGNSGFTAKFSEEQQTSMKARSEKVGLSLEQVEELLKLTGNYAPVFFSAITRLVELLKEYQGDDLDVAYKSHGECPEEVGKAVCDAEQAALESLAYAMHARRVCCCDHDHYEKS